MILVIRFVYSSTFLEQLFNKFRRVAFAEQTNNEDDDEKRTDIRDNEKAWRKFFVRGGVN